MRTLLLATLLAACPGAKDDTGEPVDCSTPDRDGDGWDADACGGTDCDDGDADVWFGADDPYGDGLDQNCDGVDGTDLDADGHADAAEGGTDCDDTDMDVHPGAEDLLGDDLDQDCDGVDGTDADGDRFASEASGGRDCDDTDPEVNPAASDGGTPGSASIDSEWTANWTSVASAPDGTTWAIYGLIPDTDGTVRCNLYVANDASGTWSPSSLEGSESSGCVADVAVSPAGNVWVAWIRSGTGLRFAERDGSGTFSPVTVAAGASGSMKILAGADGEPAVVFESGNVLSVARRTAATWTTETVSSATPVYGLDAAMDADGAVHVAWVEEGSDDVLYSTNASGSWRTETVGADADLWHPAMGLAPDGTPHVAYFVESGSQSILTHATRTSGTWATEDVATVNSATALSLAVDGAGGLHLAYSYSYYGSALLYSVRTAGAGGWSSSNLVPDGGTDVDVAIGVDGTVHFSHRDGGNVLHAWMALPDGVDNDCDGVAW